MEIIKIKGQEYIILEIYKSFCLCQKITRGERECFSKFDLGLIKKIRRSSGTKWEKEEPNKRRNG